MGETTQSQPDAPAKIRLASEPPFVVGELGVNPATRQVQTIDREETLEPRVMQVLCALERANGSVVSRDELIETCWDGRIVGDDAIHRVLFRLRGVAEGIGGGSFHIETIRGVGYRLRVDRHGESSWQARSVSESGRAGSRDTPSPIQAFAAASAVSRRLAIGGGAAIIVAGAAGGWFLFKPKVAVASSRIAVLPFANLSGDPAQVYFSDGIAEQLRSSLSRAGMQVIGRTSSEAVKNLDTNAAAAKLDVANILTGSVRRSKSTIRIDVQLVSGSDGVERWAQSYDHAPSDSIKIQTDIARKVLQELSSELGKPGRVVLTAGDTNNPEAQDLLLQAVRDESTDEAGIERQLALLNAALSLDPNYAEAYARKATLLDAKSRNAQSAGAAIRGRAEALDVASRAIAIAPRMALGYAERARIYLAQFQFERGLADARNAMELPSDDALSIDTYPILLIPLGRFREALHYNEKAISLDPLNPRPHALRSEILYFARRYSEAVNNARFTLQLAPQLDWARAILCLALLFQGKPVEAEIGKFSEKGARMTFEALVAARAGQRTQALSKMEAVGTNHYWHAEIYGQLRMTDEALKELELAWQVRDPAMINLAVDPILDPLRNDPRLAALKRKIGFPNS